jgi:hypothetical protein
VPILLQNDFAHLGAQDRFNIRRQCAMLIQKSMRLDSIVSTVSPRRLLQQNLPTAVIRTCAAHDDGFRALVHQPVWHEFPFAGGIYEIVSEHAAGSA